jgi:hypothetical protein
VDTGLDENGKRKQLTRTFDTQREARDELSRVRHETNLGTYVKPSKETLNTHLDCKRTLHLDDELVQALTARLKHQMDESGTAGTAYQSGLAVLDWYFGGE